MDDKTVNDQATKAFPALCKYVKKKKGNDPGLLDEVDKVFLEVVFQKLPQGIQKTIKICLPHKIVDDPSDICLFVRDINKTDRDYTITVNYFQELMKKKGITDLPAIMPMKSLKMEYQPFEAKMHLSNMYSKYLADASIVTMLPSYLGKNFYGKKKIPLQMNLDAKNLKKEFEKAIKTTQCIISGKGSGCIVAVAHTGLPESNAVDNIVAAVKKLSADIPGGSSNIKSLYLKTTRSPALPIYFAQGSPEGIQLKSNKRPLELDELEEIDFVDGAKVRVTADSQIQLVTEEGDSVFLGESYGNRSSTRSHSYRGAGQIKRSYIGAHPARFSKKKSLKTYHTENKKILGQQKNTTAKTAKKSIAKTNKRTQKNGEPKAKKMSQSAKAASKAK